VLDYEERFRRKVIFCSRSYGGQTPIPRRLHISPADLLKRRKTRAESWRLATCVVLPDGLAIAGSIARMTFKD
jgi:hypothetical protein